MGKYSRLGKNTVLVFIGNAGSKLIGLLMLPFYTRWLSVEDYGVTDIISVYVTFLFGIVTCCIAEAVFIFPKGASLDAQKGYFSSAVGFVGLMLVGTGIVFGLIHFFTPHCSFTANSFTDNIWLIYFMLISQVAQQLVQQFVRSIDKMVVYSMTGIVVTLCTALFAFLLIPQNGVKGFVWSIIAANLCGAIYSFLCSGAYLYCTIDGIRISYCRPMLKYSVPLIPNDVMWWLVSALNRPLMEHYLGLHDIGLFAVANKFPGILSMLFTVFVSAWQISVLEEFGKKGYEDFYNKMTRLVFIGLSAMLLIITLCSKFLVTLFASADFYVAWQYVPILTMGVLFSNISGFVGTNFSATRESKYFFYSSIWGAVAAVGLNFLLIPVLGVLGACLSVLFSFFAMAISRIVYSWQYVHVRQIGIYLFMITLNAITIVLVNLEVSWWLLAASSLITLGFYIVSSWKSITSLIGYLMRKYPHK